jgi:transposase
MTSIARQDLVWVGLDVHKISISAAVIRPGTDTTEETNLMADDASVRKFFSHQGPPERLRVCYEAGPTGYDLQRKLAGMGISCQVAAPSLIPKASGELERLSSQGERGRPRCGGRAVCPVARRSLARG